MFSLSQIIAVSATLFVSAQAHFTLDYPPARGPFVAKEELKFCSGYPTQSNNRSLFPISNGVIEVNSHHDSATFVALISFDADPQNFEDFNHTDAGQQIPLLKPFLQLKGPGELCVPVDVSALGINGVGPGTNATILIQFVGGDGSLYQCSDVTLTNDTSVTAPSCTNGTTVTAISTTNTSTTSTAGASATPTNGAELLRLSPVAVLAFAGALFAAAL
ncbi:hypothetical protein FRC04_012031 [Tulasnella sp. 424]|nr:hypothetical protein FRC04_012031 [Tulasnella sp. 424]KAG8971271.1 hypothetical protein FRC05_011370 [Tulasnella sp. 425]